MYADIYDVLIKNDNYIFLDLYCGVGVMSLIMNDFYKKCIGVEINKNSIEIANYNKKINNSLKCNFICSSVEDIINNLNYENLIIFVNPPRRGLYENVIKKLNKIKNKVKQVIYLSCCRKTLDRDLKLFDYNNKLLKSYNMFPNTNHYEYLVELF